MVGRWGFYELGTDDRHNLKTIFAPKPFQHFGIGPYSPPNTLQPVVTDRGLVVPCKRVQRISPTATCTNQGRAQPIGMKSATGGVKRLKKCAQNIPPGHIKALKIAKPLMRPTIKFSLQGTSTDLSNCHMHLYRVELINAMGYVLRMWRTDEKMCAKHPPRSPTYFKHI